jgi:UDP-glucose 4-epimerase
MSLSFKGSRVLIVGGAGFVGSNLAHRLLQEDLKELIIVDNLLSAHICNVPTDKRVTFHLNSIAEDRLLAKLPDDVDFIFHLSTYHGNQSSIANPLEDHEHNTLTTLKLCERYHGKKSLKKLVYAGAGCTVAKKTFEETEATDEEAPVSLYLDSPYQISKMIGEFYGNYYFMRYALPFVKARFQNVYGPREILGAGKWRGTPATVWRNVTPTFVWKALHNQPLPVENGGIATRDFIYVEDMAEGLMACALKGATGGVYNLASGIETSIKELSDTINELTGNKAVSESAPIRSWDRSGRRFGTTSKAQQELGFEAKVTIREGLQKTIEWTKNHHDVITQAMAQHDYFMNLLKS